MEYRPIYLSNLGKPFSAESMQEMWRMVLDTLRDPVFLHDRNYCITRANRAYACMAGLDFSELIGKPYWQVFPKGTGPLISCAQAMANPLGRELEETVEANGNIYISRSIPVTNVTGEYLYSLHIMEDITPLRESVAMVSRSDEQFRLVSRSISEVFWMADISLERFYYVNRMYESIWGRSRFDLYLNSHEFLDAIHPDDRMRVLADFDAQKTGQAFEHECRVITPDGTVHWILNRGFPLADDMGHYHRHIGVALDISELKRTEEQLRQLNQTLEKRVAEQTQQNIEQERMLIEQSRNAVMGEMIRNIAHQWRQPLSTVGLVVQNIREDFKEGKLSQEELDSEVETAMRCINHMSQTIDDFRNFFHTDKTAALFDLTHAINDSLKLIKATLKNNIIQVRLSGDRGVQAFGLASEYSQVILNLLNNAADALVAKKVPHGKIEIELSSNEHSGIVVIRDNAGGIPEEIQAKIFDPYFTTKVSGSGIGLYMSKIIIEKHMGGSITCRNSGEGAEFTASIPLMPNDETKPQ